MENVNIFLIISVLCLFFSVLSTIIGLVALVKVIAAEKATHTVTYTPIDEEIEKANQKTMEDWANKSQSWIAKDQKEFKEDLEADFPEFLTEEDDDGAISI